MVWETLGAVRLSTTLEFTSALARRHHFVRLTDGRWTRTYGPPADCVNVGVRKWRVKCVGEDAIKRAVRKDVAEKQKKHSYTWDECPNNHDLEDVEASNVEWEERKGVAYCCGCGGALGHL